MREGRRTAAGHEELPQHERSQEPALTELDSWTVSDVEQALTYLRQHTS